MLDSSICTLDGKMTDPCPFEAIAGLTTEEAIKLLEIEIFMRHTMSEKLRNRLSLMQLEQSDLEGCLNDLRKDRLRMDKLLEMFHTPYLCYNPKE